MPADTRRAGRRRTAGRRPRRPSRLTGTQKVLLAVAAVLAAALAGVLAYRSLFVKPALPQDPADSGAQPIDWGEGVQPRAGGARKSQDWYTVLILGRDTGGGGNTDTMLLASYDVTNQRATVMSIPRDTMVNVPWDVKKINSVYNGCGGGDKGIRGLYQEISQLVGFAPDFQVVVEWEAVGEIVDAVGGVWYDVPYFMEYDDPKQDLHIYQPDGYRRLSGEDAMQVIRWRENNSSSTHGHRRADGGIGDSGRMEIQQGFLRAMAEQLLQLENVTRLGQIAKVFQENVETDLSFQNILWLARSAYLGGLSMENVCFVTMPYRNASAWSRYYGQTLSYVVPQPQALLELVNRELSPFAEEFTLSDLDILSVNSDGSIRSSTGRVEDARAAVPPAGPAESAPEPEAGPDEATDSAAGTAPDAGTATGPGTGTPPDPGAGTAADPGAETDPNAGTAAEPETGGTTDPGAGADTEPGAREEGIAPMETTAPAEPPADPGAAPDGQGE